MSNRTELTTAAATLACALGIGFVMQSGEAASSRYGATDASAETQPMPPLAEEIPFIPEPVLQPQEEAALDIRAITLTSAEIAKPAPLPLPKKPALLSAEVDFTAPAAPDAQAEIDCPVTAIATPDAAAMVRLALSAPCNANERVTISHMNMTFVETTSPTGTLDLLVPTLAEDAVFSLSLTNGDLVEARADVPSIALYDRIVLQWAGEPGVQIHALEFGATYGEDGHVWIGAPRDMSAVARGQGGFLMRHGDPDASEQMLAEVYTFPAAMAKSPGAVTLSVEAEVTQANCGTDISASTLEVRGGGAVQSQDLNMSIPACDAVGNFLVLNNLFKDLTVASN